MHRKVWTDAPFGGGDGGGFVDAAWGGRSPLCDGGECDDGDWRGRVGSRVDCIGECVGGFGGGAQRRRGWMERCARRQPGRVDRTCRGDRADESRHVLAASDLRLAGRERLRRTPRWCSPPLRGGGHRAPMLAQRRMRKYVATWCRPVCSQTSRRATATRRQTGWRCNWSMRSSGGELARVARREPRFPARKRRCAQAVAVRRAVSRFHSIPERLPLRQYASTGFGSASTSAPNASTSASPIRSRSTGR